jgi:hypothetical protein
MMPDRYGTRIFLVIYLAFAAVTLACFFVLWGHEASTASFRVSLLAVLAAETALWQYANYMNRNLERVKRSVPAYLALGTVLAAYFALTIVYSLFTALAKFVQPYYLLLHLITLAAVIVVGALLLLFTRSTEKHERAARTHVSGLREIEFSLRQLQGQVAIMNGAGKQHLVKAIDEFIESVQYSDPVTPDSIAGQDLMLLEELRNLNEIAASMNRVGGQDHELGPIFDQIQQLRQKWKLRNERLLALKS